MGMTSANYQNAGRMPAFPAKPKGLANYLKIPFQKIPRKLPVGR